MKALVILSLVGTVWALAKMAVQHKQNRALLRRIRETGEPIRIDS